MPPEPTIDYGAAERIREADPSRDCRRLKGRVALLTAAARGIGLASALRLAGEGATVCITDRDEAALRHASELAGTVGLALLTAPMDSSNRADVRRVIDGLLQQHDHIDVLVNNAGGSLHTPYHFMDESDEHWKLVMDLNLMSAIWASQAVVPAMAARGYGRIVNFGSKAGRFGSLIAGPNYAAAKGAIAALTRQMAMEFGPQGITVNCICPGVTMTARTRDLWAERRSADDREKVLQEIPMRRHCEVEDVAASVAFLASDDASFVTGVTLDLNGGQGMA
jgi:NAD(P)-dependent dehydrogenase (short-subunit alcohol dehydrogenase family)